MMQTIAVCLRAAAAGRQTLRSLSRRQLLGLWFGLLVVIGGGCVLGLELVELIRFGRATSAAAVPGAYHGEYVVGSESLVLHADSTFQETYRDSDGATYHQTGSWENRMRDGHRYVRLTDAIVFGFGGEPPLVRTWELRVHRGLLGRITLKADDPDGIIELRQAE